MTVLRAGRRKELLAQIEMDAPLYSRPAVVGDALYLATPTTEKPGKASILNPQGAPLRRWGGGGASAGGGPAGYYPTNPQATGGPRGSRPPASLRGLSSGGGRPPPLSN